MSDKTPVAVSATVFKGLEAVRRSGLTNMFDRPAVATIADEMGFEEAAKWVRENRKQFATGIFNGFVASTFVEPGKVMRYVGKTHPGITSHIVKILRKIDEEWWEFAPWIEEKGRYSWITSDGRAEEFEELEEKP